MEEILDLFLVTLKSVCGIYREAVLAILREDLSSSTKI